MEDTDCIINEFFGGAENPTGCMMWQDEVTPFSDLENNHGHACSYDDNLFQAPDVKDLEEFFSNEDFFGEQPAEPSETDPIVADQPPTFFFTGDNSCYDTSTDYVDSGAATSPASTEGSTGSANDFVNDDGLPVAKKRRQNREAARRYRMKKKTVLSAVAEEEKILEEANSKLRQKIDRWEAKLTVIKDILRHQYGFPADSDIVLVQIA